MDDDDEISKVEGDIPDEEIEDSDIEVDSDIKKNSKSKVDVNPSEEDNLDEEIGLSTQNKPSSMGIIFSIEGKADTINCEISFATYRDAKKDDCKIPYFPSEPDSFEVPQEISLYIRYCKEENCLIPGELILDRKQVSEMQRSGILEDNDYGLFDALYKIAEQYKRGFVRIPHKTKATLEFGESDCIDNIKDLCDLCGTKAKVTAVRKNIKDNIYSVTIMLVNDNESKSYKGNCLFQPEIRVKSTDNSFIFKDITAVNFADESLFGNLDDEEKSLELLYRNKLSYGTGLGTSLNWSIDEMGEGELFSDFFPEKEVPQMDFNLPSDSNVNEQTLSMKHLSDLNDFDKEGKITNLISLVEAYEKWISSLEEKLNALDSKYREIASKNIQGCKHSFERMKAGIETLRENNNAWASFELANRAMFMQRVHLTIQKETSDKDRYPYDSELSEILENINYSDDGKFTSDKYFWRPFQLAFMLMSVNSIVNDDSSDRELVDLIWFPTGGGKTEAYLLLTAFTIFYRRLAHPNESGGTSVIMRYTLRLLAAQQFTRASTLICACEYIRCDCAERKPLYKKYPLGDNEISIGLWIGDKHTPNKNDTAKKELRELTKSTITNLKENKDKHNKFQVLKCPWCGTKLVRDRVGKKLVGAWGYEMKNNSHFIMRCLQESCFFNQTDKLPVQIVDEELYLNPPTLLFGTVDKFAMLPWKKDIGNYFALNSNNRTPELIIQDELHLISGPLGTMVGMYESAIDYLIQSKGTKSKIVASTATIRRAAEQCSALYDRDVSQFPHPGLDAEDSFFARESKIDYSDNKYGRLYVGLMPSGKTKATMEIKSAAALLQTINTMSLSDEVRDKFWTLTVYFNSLKDLGKCNTLVDDEIKEFIKKISRRFLGDRYIMRRVFYADELTSRVSTTELNETLDKLEKLVYSKENRENKRYASDILLATNMISVGIDVARLNVMLMVGQPKLTAEYIQASSRVGREFPGVAFTMYDSSKSRDRSHYEQFRQYHDSFYKFVEPTGATPFSRPARDRALGAVVISVLRHLIPELSDEKSASNFNIDEYADNINRIKTFLINRDKSLTKRLKTGMTNNSAEIASEIDSVLEDWERRAESFGENHFSYGEKYMNKRPEEGEGRLLKAYNTDYNDSASRDTMTSMRNVDAGAKVNILIWEEE